MNMKQTMAVFFLIAAGWAPAGAQETPPAPRPPRLRTTVPAQSAPAQPGSRPPASAQSAPAPAAPESAAWYLNVDGQDWGPYDMAEMQSMVPTRDVTAETLVWKDGMADWAAAGTVPELRALFTGRRAASGPPPASAQPRTPAPAAPAPAAWYLDVDGQEWGPYDMTAMQSMVPTGQVTAETLVWKDGMADWAAAGTTPELRALFPARRAASGPPPAPAAPAPDTPAAPEFSTGRRAGMAALNPILGLGSYLMKDWLGGGIVSGLEVATLGLVLWEVSLDKGSGAYGVPGTLVFFTGGAAVIFGVIRPIFYHRKPPTKKTAALMKGLDIGLVQTADTPRGETAPGVRIRYSFQY